MAKKPAITRKDAPSSGKQKVQHRLNTIKPPAAPALVQSEEVGAPVGRDRAIREKLRLYPRATVKEIVAMFELEGLRVDPAAVQKVKRHATP